MLYYPPDLKPDGTPINGVTPIKYDLDVGGLEAESLLKFIENSSGVAFTIRKPINYMKYVFAMVVVLCTLVVFAVMKPYLAAVYENKKIWLIACVVYIFYLPTPLLI